MVHPEKNEASLAGEASQVENKDEFRIEDTSPPNFFIADSGAQSNSYPNLVQRCLDHMASNEIPLESEIILDGKFHRFSIDSKKNKKDEWYISRNWVFKDKEYLACDYGSWSTDQKFQFQSWDDDELSRYSQNDRKGFARFLEEMEKKVQEETRKRHEEAALEAQQIWDKALEKPENEAQVAYLKKKCVNGYGVRYGKNPQGFDALIIPLQNVEGKIRSLQFISIGKDGTTYKTFLAGGEKRGCFAVLGDLENSSGFYVAEGFSTAASSYECTGVSSIIAFDCGNLSPVISALRKKYRRRTIIIAADDDVENPQNPGRIKAEEAARQYKCEAKFPTFPDDCKLPDGKRPTDFNDLHVHFGIEAVKDQLINDWYNKTPVPFREASYRFELSKLPEEFRKAVLEEYRFIKSPLETIATMGVVVINAAIGKSAVIEEVPGLEHNPKLAFINVLAQGERKSQSFKDMAKELDQYQSSREKEHEIKVRSIRAKNRLIDEKIKALSSNRRPDSNKPPKSFDEILGEIAELEARKESIPPIPKIYTTDTTEQRLFELMEERNGEFAVLAGEGRAIINTILGAYNNGQAADSIYLAGISGDKITRDRIGQNNERIELTIEDPCLNMGIMIQPDKWSQMANNSQLQESGFLARLFVIYPPSRIGDRETVPGEKRGLIRGEVQPYHDKIKLILENRDKNRERNHTHKVLLVDDVALARDELHNEMERKCRPGEKFSENSFTTGIASKFTSQVCKLALSLHIFKFPNILSADQSFLSLATWSEARSLGEYFLNETLRALRLSIDSKSKTVLSIEEKLLVWLYNRHKEGKPRAEVRDIQNNFRPRGKSADEIREQWLKKLRENVCARETPSGEVELHPCILEHGLEWLKGQRMQSEDV